MIDWEGEDHRLSNKPNTQGFNLPPHMKPAALPNALYFKYPQSKKEAMLSFEENDHQKRVIPNINDYDGDQLRGMGFATGGANQLVRILRKYGPFDSLAALTEFIKLFPTNVTESEVRYRQKAILAKKVSNFSKYESLDFMASASKPALTERLEGLLAYGIMDTNKKSPEFIKLLEQGKNLVLSFSGNSDLARVVGHNIMEAIIAYRKRNADGVRPYIFFEEADKLFSADVIDPEEKKRALYVMSETVDKLKRSKKHALGVCFITPTLTGFDKTMLDNVDEYFFMKMEKNDREHVRRYISESASYTVSKLDFNRYTNYREALFINEFGNEFPIKQPFACPQAYHIEG